MENLLRTVLFEALPEVSTSPSVLTLFKLYGSLNIIRDCHVKWEQMREVCKMLVGNPEWKWPEVRRSMEC